MSCEQCKYNLRYPSHAMGLKKTIAEIYWRQNVAKE